MGTGVDHLIAGGRKLEALQYDIEIPCTVQWEMLGFSAPTCLNNDLLNDGEIFGECYEAVNLAFHNVLVAPSFGMNTPRILFLKAMRKVLEDMPERNWNREREMVGWQLGDRPDLLPGNGDSDNEMEPLGR